MKADADIFPFLFRNVLVVGDGKIQYLITTLTAQTMTNEYVRQMPEEGTHCEQWVGEDGAGTVRYGPGTGPPTPEDVRIEIGKRRSGKS